MGWVSIMALSKYFQTVARDTHKAKSVPHKHVSYNISLECLFERNLVVVTYFIFRIACDDVFIRLLEICNIALTLPNVMSANSGYMEKTHVRGFRRAGAEKSFHQICHLKNMIRMYREAFFSAHVSQFMRCIYKAQI